MKKFFILLLSIVVCTAQAQNSVALYANISPCLSIKADQIDTSNLFDVQIYLTCGEEVILSGCGHLVHRDKVGNFIHSYITKSSRYLLKIPKSKNYKPMIIYRLNNETWKSYTNHNKWFVQTPDNVVEHDDIKNVLVNMWEEIKICFPTLISP